MRHLTLRQMADLKDTIVDPKLGGLLAVSGREDRDLVRLMIMNTRIEALRPITNLLPAHSAVEASYVASTYEGKLIYVVVVDGALHASGRMSEVLREARRSCRFAGGRLQVWTGRRIKRAYPAAVARTYQAAGSPTHRAEGIQAVRVVDDGEIRNHRSDFALPTKHGLAG